MARLYRKSIGNTRFAEKPIFSSENDMDYSKCVEVVRTMKNYDIPTLDIEEEVTFGGIPDDLFDSIMGEIDDVLQQKMIENRIQESQSMKFASRFITT